MYCSLPMLYCTVANYKLSMAIECASDDGSVKGNMAVYLTNTLSLSHQKVNLSH